MNPQQAYNIWASQYDTNSNKTRDLEALALRQSLVNISFDSCLEIGCGTGKNTEWLSQKAKQVTAVDLSEQMLAKAKEKITFHNVQFKQADITKDWSFRDQLYDLVSFSLVLEHINELDHVFKQTSQSLFSGGHVYIGELHPFKQYTGSKARFETTEGLQVLECFTHHVSDYFEAALKNNFRCIALNEWFDENDRTTTPRLISFLFQLK